MVARRGRSEHEGPELAGDVGQVPVRWSSEEIYRNPRPGSATMRTFSLSFKGLDSAGYTSCGVWT